jgi:hypothetical protein
MEHLHLFVDTSIVVQHNTMTIDMSSRVLGSTLNMKRIEMPLQCCMDRESCEMCKKHKFAPNKLLSKKKYRCHHSECQKMYK